MLHWNFKLTQEVYFITISSKMWASIRRFPSSLRLFSSINVTKSNDRFRNCCRRKNDSLINCMAKANNSSFEKEFYLETSSFEFVPDSVTDIDKRVELIKMEHQVMLETGAKVPTQISDENWIKLAEIKTHFNRKRYFNYLFKTETYIIGNKRRQEEKRIRREQLLLEKQENEGDHLTYGLFKNTFFYYISYTRMTLIYNWLHLSAVTFGQIMVIDLDFDHLMSDRELKNAAEQIKIAYGLNKVSKVPWNLYVCNAKPHSGLLKYLKFAIPNLETPNCLVTVTEKSYLDILPRERLVYLSGNSPKLMGDFDHDAIYIIGGFVDMSNPIPASMSKAKKEEITAMQLPLHKYLRWGTGKRNLTINQVAGILIDLKVSGEWQTALKHVPIRKLRNHAYKFTPRVYVDSNRLSSKVKSLFQD